MVKYMLSINETLSSISTPIKKEQRNRKGEKERQIDRQRTFLYRWIETDAINNFREIPLALKDQVTTNPTTRRQ